MTTGGGSGAGLAPPCSVAITDSRCPALPYVAFACNAAVTGDVEPAGAVTVHD